jgi:hypothetical protein
MVPNVRIPKYLEQGRTSFLLGLCQKYLFSEADDGSESKPVAFVTF